MSVIESSSPEELSILASAVAISLARDRTKDEINVLGNFTAAVGAILLTIAAQKESIDTLQDKKQQLKDLKKELKR
ncbi:MAG: hypothetical protein F8N39_19220 [Clostridiaceae bacterium]|nr:hypothetical protein [Clostridiaceae bacterium]